MQGTSDSPTGPWVLRPAVCGALLALLALALSLALADRGLPPNDEGALLTNAARILRGGVYYRDIDSYPFPGAAYLLAGAMALAGERVAVGRLLAAGLFALTVASLYAAASLLLERRRAALFGLSLLSFKFLAWPAFTAYLYSDLAFAAGALALALYLRHPQSGGRGALLGAGAALGACLLAKQNLGIYLTLATGALLLLPGPGTAGASGRAARLALFGGGLALALAPPLAWFAGQGLLGAMLESGLLRPFTAYLPTSGVSYARALAWWELGSLRGVPAFPYFVAPYWVMLNRGDLPGGSESGAWWLLGELVTRVLYTAIPLVFAAALLRLARGGRAAAAGPGRAFLAVALFAGAAVLSAFPRADFFHVVSVAPLVLLLAFALRRPSPARFWPEAVAVALLLLATGLGLLRYAAGLEHRLSLERAELRVEPEAAWVESVARYAAEEVPPGAGLFVYGNEAIFYFLADRYAAWPFAQLYPGQTGRGGGAELVASLRRAPPALVIRGALSWPGLPALPSYTPALFQELRAGFELDPRVFERHPVRGGSEPPAAFLAVLRPRRLP